MMAAPTQVQWSMYWSNSQIPSTTVKGSRTKSNGMTADASATFRAFVNSKCAMVPNPPSITIHSQVCADGHCQTANAGNSESGAIIKTI